MFVPRIGEVVWAHITTEELPNGVDVEATFLGIVQPTEDGRVLYGRVALQDIFQGRETTLPLTRTNNRHDHPYLNPIIPVGFRVMGRSFRPSRDAAGRYGLREDAVLQVGGSSDKAVRLDHVGGNGRKTGMYVLLHLGPWTLPWVADDWTEVEEPVAPNLNPVLSVYERLD